MLAPVPLFASILMISLCCEGQVPCSSYRLLIVKGCLWYKKFLIDNVRQLEVALPSPSTEGMSHGSNLCQIIKYVVTSVVLFGANILKIPCLTCHC